VTAAPAREPELSVVVLAWNNLELTRAFVGSVRANTDCAYELIIVDNGSEPMAAAYAGEAADVPVLNDTNRGFARGMNQGLSVARGEFVAFCNNDTLVPERWASSLVATARAHERAAIVVPAITTASNPVTVRTEPGTDVTVLAPFSAPPAAVVYVMSTKTARAIGGFDERYEIASAEDVDLGFTVWVNDLDIVFDERVLVQHVGHASGAQLENSADIWARNRHQFLDRWVGPEDPPFLGTCDRERFLRNRATARSVARWMQQYFTIRDGRRQQTSTTRHQARPRSLVRRAVSKVRRLVSR
jgi:GT2 family glycosyltransferase